jgi:hypothetical protein
MSSINFYALIGDGGKAGAREVFERLVVQLVRLQHRTMRIKANPGDWGIDALVGELDGGTVAVWQAKFFIDGAGQGQQGQIRESFEAAIAAAEKEGHTLGAWTLCMPVSFDAPTAKWWSSWRRRMKTKHGVRIELWDDTELEALLLTPDATHVRDAYFHTPAVSLPCPPVKALPAGITYDEMLFMKQLRAASVAEVESAKHQFFNADLLAREVADKRVPEHMEALETTQGEAHALWENRFNAACAQQPADPTLPGLHSQVMVAIEQHHNAHPPNALPMNVVHRLGSMHQVVENGEAGWVREFRSIAEGHRG